MVIFNSLKDKKHTSFSNKDFWTVL